MEAIVSLEVKVDFRIYCITGVRRDPWVDMRMYVSLGIKIGVEEFYITGCEEGHYGR